MAKMTNSKHNKILRNQQGNTLALSLALVVGIGWVFLYFGWQYTKQLSGYQEQRVAIDAAALAAAKDLSRIVVEDPNIGFVSLSDYAPVGKANGNGTSNYTVAADGFAVSVQSINTVLATTRLDMIIANQIDDPVMQQLAQIDYNNAIGAQTRLTTALSQIIPPSGTYNPSGTIGYDVDGNIVNPVQDAINAYTQNVIRIAGRPSLLVPNSLKLTLGYVPGLQTSRAPLPQPNSFAQVPATQQANGYYLPNVQVYLNNNNPMVFAALGNDLTLVDYRQFQTNIGLNYSTPTVVKCEADQEYYDFDAFGNQVQATIHAVSAAEASCILDQRPCPGAFQITFLNGGMPEIATVGDLLNEIEILGDPTDLVQTPLTGDYPQTALSQYSFPNTAIFPIPVDPAHPNFTYLVSIAFYDWIRRAGTNVNITNLVNKMFYASIATPAKSPTVYSFQFNSSGNITSSSIPATSKDLSVSQNQWRALSGLGFTSTNGKQYDLQLTNYVYQECRAGGQHFGEPLTNPGKTGFNAAGQFYVGQTLYENTTWPYQEFATGPGSNGTVRPTYNSNGVAVDFTFRQRM